MAKKQKPQVQSSSSEEEPSNEVAAAKQLSENESESGEYDMEEYGEEEQFEILEEESLEEGQAGQSESQEDEDEQNSSKDSQSDKSEGDEVEAQAPERFGTKTFKELQVSPWLINNLETMGITQPTVIQEQSLAHSLKPRTNVIGCAHTGSGKTACFAIPILQKLAKDPYGIFALVLTPTRELAFQIRDQFLVFAGQTVNLRISVIVGGMDMMKQSQELSDIPHIIIATPGRLVHQLIHDQANLHEYLENLQFLVFDEADRLLTDESFKTDLQHILKCLPESERQTFLFSATMASDYDRHIPKEALYGKGFKDENIISCGAQVDENDKTFTLTVKGLRQQFILVPQNVKEAYLIHILKTHKLRKNQQCIIFTSTCKNCHFLALLLRELEFDVALIHSQLDQRTRTNNLLKFKSNFCKILIATDVASRGLDIPSVEFVLNFDVTKNPKDYVHRVGRTARAGRGGTSMTIVSQYDVKLLLSIEDFIESKLEKVKIDENEVMEDQIDLLKITQVVRIKMSEQGLDEKFDAFKKQKAEMREKRQLLGKRQASSAK